MARHRETAELLNRLSSGRIMLPVPTDETSNSTGGFGPRVKSFFSTVGRFLWNNRKKLLLVTGFITAAVLLFLFPPAFLTPLSAAIGVSVFTNAAIWTKVLMVIAGAVGTFIASGILMKIGQKVFNWFTNRHLELTPIRPHSEDELLQEPKSRWQRFKGFVKEHPVLLIALGLGVAMAIGLAVALFVFSGGTSSIVLPAVFLAIKKALFAYLPLVVAIVTALTAATIITIAAGTVIGLTDTALQLDVAEQENIELNSRYENVNRLLRSAEAQTQTLTSQVAELNQAVLQREQERVQELESVTTKFISAFRGNVVPSEPTVQYTEEHYEEDAALKGLRY